MRLQFSLSRSPGIMLSIMMLMQYMTLAVWWVPLAAYLANLEMGSFHKSLILSSFAIGSLASPIIGMIADRHFPSEKVLLVLNFCTAGLLLLSANTKSPSVLLLLVMLTMLCYMPTWSLTSSIAMAHTSAEQFPRIRVFGSVGWVLSGLFSLAAVQLFNVKIFDGSSIPLYCGAATSLLAAICNLFLPATPPPAKGKKASLVDSFGLRAFCMLKDRNFRVFLILSTFSILPFSLYHVYGSEFLQDMEFQFITFTMNLGQFVEIFFLIIATTIIVRLGVKWALILGLSALLLRYLSFFAGIIFDRDSMHILGVLVHGIIFGLFYVGGQVYTERKAPKELKAQAQGILAFMVWGVGMFAGILMNGWLIGIFQADIEGVLVCRWDSVFAIISLSSMVILLLFILFFKESRKQVINSLRFL
jgi:nucleoside transporter